MPVAFHKNRFESLQVLRAITALIILTEHVRFLGHGLFGVDIFFCLSGFMLMLSTEESGEFFLRRRLVRLLPLYYLMTFITFFSAVAFPDLFELTDASPINLLKSLCFIPFDIGNGAIQPLVRVGWTLNCELFFCVLFGLSLILCKKTKLPHSLRAILPCTVLLLICIVAQCSDSENLLLSFYGNPVMLNFIFGILGYYLAKYFYEKQTLYPVSKVYAGLLLVLAFLLGVCLLLSRETVAHATLERVVAWEIPAFCIVLCFYLAGLSLPMAKPLVMLGNISFSFYLLHYYPVMWCDRYLFDFSKPTPFALAGVAVAILISTILAFVSYELIEKRLTGRLYRLLHIEKSKKQAQ